MIINTIPPSILDILPNLSFNFLPSLTPRKVKEVLVIVKIIKLPIMLFVIKLSPNPVENESRLTENANISIPKNEVSNFFSSVLNEEKSISIPIKLRIINIKYFPSIIKCSITKFPIVRPTIGIKKWKTPTIIDNIIVLLVFKFNVP